MKGYMDNGYIMYDIWIYNNIYHTESFPIEFQV